MNSQHLVSGPWSYSVTFYPKALLETREPGTGSASLISSKIGDFGEAVYK